MNNVICTSRTKECTDEYNTFKCPHSYHHNLESCGKVICRKLNKYTECKCEKE